MLQQVKYNRELKKKVLIKYELYYRITDNKNYKINTRAGSLNHFSGVPDRGAPEVVQRCATATAKTSVTTAPDMHHWVRRIAYAILIKRLI